MIRLRRLWIYRFLFAGNIFQPDHWSLGTRRSAALIATRVISGCGCHFLDRNVPYPVFCLDAAALISD